MKRVRSFLARHPMGWQGVVSALVLLFVLVNPLVAQWSSDPSENTPVYVGPGGQTGPVAVGDGSGGIIIAWQSWNDVYAQHLDAFGIRTWEVEGIAVSTAPGRERVRGICTDGAGGAIIAWVNFTDDSSTIRAQRIDASGTIRWTPEGTVVSRRMQFGPEDVVIEVDGSGGAFIAWMDYPTSLIDRTSGIDVHAQHVSSTGEVLWNLDGVVVCSSENSQQGVRMVSDGTGGAIITWSDSYITTKVSAQRISFSGELLWSTNGIELCPGTAFQIEPVITSDGRGGAIVGWSEYVIGVSGTIRTQRISTGGERLWGIEGVSTLSGGLLSDLSSYSATITTDGQGGAIVAWADERNSDGSGSDEEAYSDIFAQRIDSSGTILWSTNGVSICVEELPQSYPEIVSDNRGGAFVVWHDQRDNYKDGIYVNHVDQSGAVRWYNGVPVSTAGGPDGVEASCDVIIDDGGNTVAVWSDNRNGNSDIFAQKIFLGNGYNSYRTFSAEGIARAQDERGREGKPVRRGKGMPNAINALEECVRQGVYPGNPVGDAAGGITVGVPFMREKRGRLVVDPDSAKKYGWLRLGKWQHGKGVGVQHQDVLKTLAKKGRLHTGAPSGFSFRKQRTAAPPTLQDNRLIAEQVALKFNILLSATGIAKPGFGELRYTNPASPLDGWLVRDIASCIDSVLTFASGEWDYGALLAVAEQLNRAFEGPVDTLNPGYPFRLALKGVQPLSAVDFLRYDPSVPPRISPSRQPIILASTDDHQLTIMEAVQNYPNPFNPLTTISFTLPEDALVTLKVYNALGQEVATLIHSEVMDEGEQEIDFDASNLPSGVYFYRLSIEGMTDDEGNSRQSFTSVRKMLLLR